MESKSLNKDDLNVAANPHSMPPSCIVQGQYELILNWYRNNSRQLIDEEVVCNLPIKTLLKILGNPMWNDLYHCWAVENKHMHNLQKFIQHKFNPDVYMYFIEAYHTK